MKGTEKQIKWAQDIIGNKFAACDAGIEISERNSDGGRRKTFAEDAECYRIIKTSFEKLFADPRMQDAATIINKRDSLPDVVSLISKAEVMAQNKGISKIEACKIICGAK